MEGEVLEGRDHSRTNKTCSQAGMMHGRPSCCASQRHPHSDTADTPGCLTWMRPPARTHTMYLALTARSWKVRPAGGALAGAPLPAATVAQALLMDGRSHSLPSRQLQPRPSTSRRPRPSTQAGTLAALWELTGALVRSPAPRADEAGSVLEVGVVLWRRRDRGGSPEPQTARPWGRFRSYYDVLRSPWSRRPTVSPDHGVAGRPSRAVRSCGRDV